MLKQTRVELKTSNLRYAEERDDLRKKLQAAEQQLGQVREEAKHLRTYVGLGEDEKVLSAKPNQMFIQRYGSKINISPYTDENNNLREALNDVQQWAESALTSDLVTGEVEDAFERIEKRASDALSATPSDGCGKGRRDKERLDWLAALHWQFGIECNKNVAYRSVTICMPDGVRQCPKDLREAIDKAMEAASSSGEEGDP